MTNEIVPVNDHKEEAPHNTKEFKGYSIEELRYQRALIALRKAVSYTHLTLPTTSRV